MKRFILSLATIGSLLPTASFAMSELPAVDAPARSAAWWDQRVLNVTEETRTGVTDRKLRVRWSELAPNGTVYAPEIAERNYRLDRQAAGTHCKVAYTQYGLTNSSADCGLSFSFRIR